MHPITKLVLEYTDICEYYQVCQKNLASELFIDLMYILMEEK